MTENLFKILIVDSDNIQKHEGEDCGIFYEVPLSPSKKTLSEYILFFRGVIRSTWQDVSQEILISIDADPVYYADMTLLKTTMENEEGITFLLEGV